MISQELAQALSDAGLRWRPAAGDRFVIPQPELSGQVFTLSEMTIEAREYPSGTILGFNGTTEWALDSVSKEDALWLPREDQLRDLLGGTFVSLHREPGGSDDGAAGEGTGGGRYVVRTRTASDEQVDHAAATAADAYAHALLALVAHAVQDAVV